MTDVTSLGVPESHADLLTEPLTAVLTTVGSDGLPQSTAVWVLVDEGALKVTVMTSRQKYRNLKRNPNATLFLIDPANPGRTLEVRGEAEVRDDPDRVLPPRFTEKYGSDPTAWDPPGSARAMVILRPRRIVTFP